MNDFNFTELCKKYYSYSTDAPKNFVEIMGIQLLGHAMGYDTVNWIRPKALHHNMYVLLVGESTLTKKSTTQELGMDIYPFERQLPYETSPEQLFAELAATPEAIQFLGELSSLLKGVAQGGWISRVVELYNDMINCRNILVRTLRKREGKESVWVIKKGYLSLSSTITPEVLKDKITEELAAGGFLCRWLLVKGEPTITDLKRLHPDVLKLGDTLRDVLKVIIEMKKDVMFELDDAAMIKYNEIQKKAFAYKNAKAFAGRYLRYMVAMADILLLDDYIGNALESGRFGYDDKAENRTLLVKSFSELFGTERVWVQSKYLDRAWEIIEPCLQNASELVNYIMYDDRSVSKLREVVRASEKISRSDAMKTTYLTAKQMTLAQDTLLQTEQIRVSLEKVPRIGHGEITKTWLIWLK